MFIIDGNKQQHVPGTGSLMPKESGVHLTLPYPVQQPTIISAPGKKHTNTRRFSRACYICEITLGKNRCSPPDGSGASPSYLERQVAGSSGKIPKWNKISPSTSEITTHGWVLQNCIGASLELPHHLPPAAPSTLLRLHPKAVGQNNDMNSLAARDSRLNIAYSYALPASTRFSPFNIRPAAVTLHMWK